MEYFLMQTDKRIANPVCFPLEKNVLNSTEPGLINIGEVYNLTQVDFIEKKKLFDYYFFLSDDLMNVFRMYLGQMEGSKPIFIINADNSIHQLYWHVALDETLGVIVNKFTKALDMEIDPERLKEKPIHKLYHDKRTFILVDRYVTESILRRLPVGIRFQEVKSMKGDGNCGRCSTCIE